MIDIVVATFYHFTHFNDPRALREPLFAELSASNLKGTVLLANEGVNGTLAGSRESINTAITALRALPNSAQLEYKESPAKSMPFYRLKVRLKREIVTMGVPGVDPLERVGTYVVPSDWNNLIADPETLVIDTRNNFEVEIGTFKGAINPQTSSFSNFPRWFEEHRAKFENKKVAMFCTGGIRCEKATSYLKGKGIDNVFHLKGGILQYLEDIPEALSLWRGECFVFDGRVSLNHALEQGEYKLCYACRRPVNAEDRLSPDFVAGVSCGHCLEQRSVKQRERYAARQAQIELLKERGMHHIGASYGDIKRSNSA